MLSRVCRRCVPLRASLARPVQRTVLLSTTPPSGGLLSRAREGIRKNISGYTRVLLVVTGMMCVVVVVAEQSIAANSVIINELPPPPPHDIYSYPLASFEPLRTTPQLYSARSSMVNVVGARGSGKTEYLRQYATNFINAGPHGYYKLQKLSNRRFCNVFVVDARNAQTLAHSLAYLCGKVRQAKGVGGATESHNYITGIKEALLKQSRWLLIFENANEELNLPELLQGFEEWGDGQIVVTSEKALANMPQTHHITSLVPRAVAEKVYFSVAPPDDVFNPMLLHKIFGGDLRAVMSAGKCVQMEQSRGIDFSFHKLQSLLEKSADPCTDVKKLYCGLVALENPKLLFALDFLGKLPASDVPVPYKFLRQHMRTTMYDNFYESLYNYSKHRIQVAPSKEYSLPPEPPTPDTSSLSFFEGKRRDYCIKLGLNPDKDIIKQLKEMREQMMPSPPEDPEMVILKECPLLHFSPNYGGHIETFSVDPQTLAVLGSLHKEFTSHLLEASLVLEQEQKFRRTWLAKLWSFDQYRNEKTMKARADILGKSKVHPVEKLPEHSPSIMDYLLVYRANPICDANMAEYQELHYKQVLRSVMAFVDVSVPDSVKGTLNTILLDGHLSALVDHLPPMFSGLAESCSLHLRSELGADDLESEFTTLLEKSRKLDPKGPFHASALHRYSVWLHRNSRDAEARVLLEEAVQFADSLSLSRTLAQVCCELGDYPTAEAHLEKAVNSVKPGDEELLGPILTDLGQVLLLQGRTTMGIKYLRGAIDGYKNMVGTENPEYARSLNVVSVGHLMLGDSLRAARARGEAGTVLANLKKKRLVVEGGL